MATNKGTYYLDGSDINFDIEVSGATPRTYVALQMVDKAVLVLNDRMTLTQQNVS